MTMHHIQRCAPFGVAVSLGQVTLNNRERHERVILRDGRRLRRFAA